MHFPLEFTAPKFRHSVCGSILSDSRSSKRPHSIISVSSSASSASSGSGSVNDNRSSNSNGHQDSPASTALVANLHNHRSKTNQSQCSAGNCLPCAEHNVTKRVKLRCVTAQFFFIFSSECRVGNFSRPVDEL
jgi:hypothetical protein